MSIIFKPEGMYTREWEYDEAREEGQYVDTRVTDFLLYLNEEVEAIRPGTTFQNFVRAFFPGGFTKENVAMVNTLADVSILPFLKEMDEKPPAKHQDDDPLTSLEIYVSAEGNKWHKKDDYELGIYLGIHGKGTKPSDTMYSISYSHWGTFANLPLSFNPETKLVLVEEKRKRKWYKPWGKRKRIYNYQQIDIEYRPTLIELMHDVFVDLCFCGSPEKRDSQMEELNRRMEEVESGTVECKKFDIDEWLNDDE